MALVFATLIIITCILLVLIVLVQNPKGGGLSSSFGGSGTQVFGGVKKTTDFLDRGTWGLAILLVVLVLATNVSLSGDEVSEEAAQSRVLDAEVSEMPDAQPIQNIPSFEGQEDGDFQLPENVDETEEK